MKCITETMLREELRSEQPACYVVPKGRILTPAAREYLQSRQIKFVIEGREEKRKTACHVAAAPEQTGASEMRVVATEVPPMEKIDMKMGAQGAKFVDHETGAFYTEKPEHMTHLAGNRLVAKDHPRILFRGTLDSLQADVVLAQAELAGEGGSEKLIADLDDILASLREMMRCDVMDEPFTRDSIIGLTHAELREQSHNPQKFFGVKAMVLPDYTMGAAFARLNRIRTAVRETEVAAAGAFRDGARYTRDDLIRELNRMSSALHIMMCRFLAGQYEKT